MLKIKQNQSIYNFVLLLLLNSMYEHTEKYVS